MPFIPHTETEIAEMLTRIGVDSIDDLFDEIPDELRINNLDKIPLGLSEMDVGRLIGDRASEDDGNLCFIGAGAYDHHVPAAIWQIAGRGEFYSAYTPYQAEASQGTLQLLYEYQSMMTALTAMDVSNASLYDGASALAEAILMAVRANRKSKSRKILIPRSLHPSYRQTAHTIVHNQNIELIEIPFELSSGKTDLEALNQYSGEDIAALVIPQPNFFGVMESVDELTQWAVDNGAISIAVVNPMALAVLEAPGNWGENGVDICVGEGQPLGLPLASGGPYFGFMCCTQKLVRQMPGRIIGRTVDTEGREGFALTLQAREQHIRRSKATSNICTNQGLMVTVATMYMALQGAYGLEQTAIACHSNIENLTEQFQTQLSITSPFSSDVFHERVFSLDKPANAVLSELADHKILGGFDLSADYPELGQSILVCATETRNASDIERYTQKLQEILG